MSRRMAVLGCQSGNALRRLAKSFAKKWVTPSFAIRSRNAQGICEKRSSKGISQRDFEGRHGGTRGGGACEAPPRQSGKWIPGGRFAFGFLNGGMAHLVIVQFRVCVERLDDKLRVFIRSLIRQKKVIHGESIPVSSSSEK